MKFGKKEDKFKEYYIKCIELYGKEYYESNCFNVTIDPYFISRVKKKKKINKIDFKIPFPSKKNKMRFFA